MPIKDPIKRKENHCRYMREVWYPKNKEIQRKRNKAWQEYIRKKIDEYKMQHGCRNCGYCLHPAALDFHHLKDKSFMISQVRTMHIRWDKIKVEIDKCEILCANCHRLETAGYFNGRISVS